MRTAFLLTIFCGTAIYTYGAFATLDGLSASGRLGPGFFPRIIGGMLMVACLYGLVTQRQQDRAETAGSSYWPTVVQVGSLFAGFILLLTILGGLLAMILFQFASLSVLNRGRLAQNAAMSLLLPLGIYALFDLWLNASMPEGLLALPL